MKKCNLSANRSFPRLFIAGLVNIRYFKIVQKKKPARRRDFERNIPFISRIKIPVPSIFPTSGSPSLSRIQKLASLFIACLTLSVLQHNV